MTEIEGADGLSDEEKVRRSGHIVLDAVVAADLRASAAAESEGQTAGEDPDHEHGHDHGHDPMELVFSHLLEIDAIELLLDEESEELELDISPLIGGTMLVVRRLVAELAAATGVPQESVVMSVRAALDEAAG